MEKEPSVLEGQVMGGKITLRELNEAILQKLYDLTQTLDEHSEPDLILACTKGISQLNSSTKNSDILEKEVSEEERAMQNKSALVGDLLKKGR